MSLQEYLDSVNARFYEVDKPKEERIPAFNKKIVEQISQKLGLEFLAEEPGEGEVCFAESKELRPEFKTYFTPLDLLDYIYAVLHSPTYRETYKEFLKIDFPRVPYPEAQEKFWQLVKLGGELRSIHLLESKKVEDFITTYPAGGDNLVSRKMTKNSPGFEKNVSSSENISSSARLPDGQEVENAHHPESGSGSQNKEMLNQARLPDRQVQDDEKDNSKGVGNKVSSSSDVSSIEVENAHPSESGSGSQNKEMLNQARLPDRQVQHDEKDNSKRVGNDSSPNEIGNNVSSSARLPDGQEVENSEKNVTVRRETTKQSPVGKVWINDEQYFDNVPEVAWEFYIGGYQPAQKWLKDRKGRKLSFEDILHYQKIIVALTETDRIMKEIDKIEIIKEED
ncbi:type ISP restriction/modification enzyme [Christiangramia fulva]|uniref:type ISP restriction/modification enzyme n=1 Tax=Christiangramia fulva TaxID=2126553 RepID=UPI001D049688|nr:type ISP restriction/modification enzyme [Christiangramia fulva]